ncbi:MAG: YraN family protein [Bacteroidales bacterium]|nr:YraN family protein [Bacteroidales bacterium]
MKNHITLGKEGEEAAVRHLEEKGYRILDRNWRWGRQEIDIIARTGPFIVFAEVKTRKSNYFSEPEDAVTKTKQRILMNVANAYVRYHKINLEVRFDVITILIQAGKQTVRHIEDAFYITLR